MTYRVDLQQNKRKHCRIIYPKSESVKNILLEFYVGKQMYGFKKITKAEFHEAIGSLLEAFHPIYLEVENVIVTLTEGMVNLSTDLEKLLEGVQDLELNEDDDDCDKD